MDPIIAKINDECSPRLARIAIESYIKVRIILGADGELLPDPAIYIDSDSELQIEWVVVDQGVTKKVSIDVDVDAMAREIPSNWVHYVCDNSTWSCGTAYCLWEEGRTDLALMKQFGEMYPEFDEVLERLGYYDEDDPCSPTIVRAS